MTPWSDTRPRDWLLAAALGVGFSLLCSWLDRPVGAQCGTDIECEATLSDAEREREFRANVNREAKARN